jgi:dihydroorotate dehydrogenase (fumarate)
MATLEVEFLGYHLKSPVLVASGPASHDVKQIKIAEQMGAGGAVLKTVVPDKFDYMRYWPRPRYKLIDWDKKMNGNSKYFTLYSYEQAYSGTVKDYFDFVEISKKTSNIMIIGSAFADEPDDWIYLSKGIEEAGADAIELDISSPHKPGTLQFEKHFVEAIKSVVKNVKIPVLVKLGPGPDVLQQSKICKELGASAVTLCNRLRGLEIDIEVGKPILHGYYAGVGGPWTKYYVFKHVCEVHNEVDITISATSGVLDWKDALKYIMLGATTVQVLSAIIVNGWETIKRINEGILNFLTERNIQNLESIRGVASKNLTDPELIIRWTGEKKSGPRNVFDVW